jgi:predicted transcriptional regulator
VAEYVIVYCHETHDYDGAVYVCSDGTILVGPEGAKPWACQPQHQARDGAGYLHVTLARGGRRRRYPVHRLVAQHHVPGFQPDLAVHHKDLDPAHNAAANLACLAPGQHTILHHAKLTRVQVRLVRELYAEGRTQSQLAGMFGVSVSSISRVIRGETYTAADGPIERHGQKGEHNGRRKLREEDVRAIRVRAKQGEKHEALAQAYGVSIWAIKDVVYRRNWAWLPDAEEWAAGF